jgi:signal transduction histidine kinase
VPENLQDSLFTLNPDARQRGPEGEKGVGLGLSLCKELALASGGDLYLDSDYKDGAAFELRLPRSA